MTGPRREPRPDVDVILEQLRRDGDAAAYLVTRENVVALLDRAGDDEKLRILLMLKL